MDLAIDLRDVAKIYRGRIHALQGIEMRVARGEIFGLLGPNGAGKSTLVKIIMTVIRPTRAVGTVLGRPVGHKPTLQKIGYLPENHRFPRYLTGRQTLDFFGALQKVDRPTRRKRAAELLDVVGMTGFADHKISTYSKGMLQRIGLGQALMSDPELVVLDEPTDGVDPVGRRDIREVLNRIRSQGKTVFLNSHLLSELEAVCDRVAILVQGTVARQGTIDDLTAKSRRYDFELDPASAGSVGLAAAVAKALGITWTSLQPGQSPAPNVPPSLTQRATLGDGTWAELSAATLSVGTAEADRVQPLVDSLRSAKLVIRRLSPVRQSLEDLFMETVIDPRTGVAPPPGARQPWVGTQAYMGAAYAGVAAAGSPAAATPPSLSSGRAS